MKIATSPQLCRLQAVWCLLLAALLIVPAQGQTQEQQVFAEVPAPLRARLIDRMKLLFEYSRTQQWENLYDLLYEPTDSKEKYVEQNTRFSQQFGNNPILSFASKSATLLYPNSGWWYIKGCAKQRKSGSIIQLEADVQARLKDGEWYFSGFGISIPIDGDPKPCSTTQKATRQNRRIAPRSSHRLALKVKRSSASRQR